MFSIITKLLIFTTICFIAILPSIHALGLRCSDHPLYYEGMGDEMVQSFQVIDGDPFIRTMFVPRVTSHTYEPRNSDQSSTKYADLSWFFAVGGTSRKHDFVSLELQRGAKVYLMIPVRYSSNLATASLPDWFFEGHAELKNGRDKPFMYGVHEEIGRFVPEYVVVFSRLYRTGRAMIPSSSWVKSNLRGARSKGAYFANIAELDGSAPRAPLPPKGIKSPVYPMKPCPKELHDIWVTDNVDNFDPDTKGMKWPTWHPAWDPCYWCAYDHEHGSSPKHLGMNYEPRYGYTAYKNNRQDESHQGFKSVVMDAGPYMVAYGVHGQTSSLRRVHEAIHSISLTVSDKRTGELLADITHKADFGPVKVRTPGFGFMPLNSRDKAEEQKRSGKPGEFNFRTINVINMKHLDKRYAYRAGATMKGLYEAWVTAPLCSATKRDGTIALDFQGAATGIISAGQITKKVVLGNDVDGKFVRQSGFSRLVSFGDRYSFGEQYCPFDVTKARAPGHAPGYFYTDAHASELRDGPGRDAILQYIKPGFKMNLSGRYDPVETFTGLSKKDATFRLQDYGYGLDPDVN